jgi:hypothetical protein
MSYHNKWKIKNRIACKEEHYPVAEAKFATIEEYIMDLVKHNAKESLIRYGLNRLYTEAHNIGFDKGFRLGMGG